MALPMLVGGSDCGPLNPLQGLSKRFDQDRGLQQDHFGARRADSSREGFRTSQSGLNVPDQDAARFFASTSSHTPPLVVSNPYDLSKLHASLPMQSQMQSQQTQNAAAAWASDFMQLAAQSPAPLIATSKPQSSSQIQASTTQQYSMLPPQDGVQWNQIPGYGIGTAIPGIAHGMPMQGQNNSMAHNHATSQALWDKEFQSHLPTSSTSSLALQENEQLQQTVHQTIEEADDLARTAGLLLETMRNEQNPKFKNSQFMGLMKQLRDREVVVEGNEMVENDQSSTSRWANEFKSDVKGKGKAVDNSARISASGLRFELRPTLDPATMGTSSVLDGPQASTSTVRSTTEQEDSNDAYFRQDNENYMQYHSEASTSRTAPLHQNPDFWDHLQADWDEFEATSTGIRPLVNYQFQTRNPYLSSDSSSRNRQHMLHLNGPQSFYESVLELEATVQRDPSNATAWFELGVKQQENEREHKALQALHRATEIDPSHLPSWLALAISHTNNNDRLGTYNSINEWVERNDKYRMAVQQFRAQVPEKPYASTAERFAHLIECLISMARSDMTGEVDADIQIALAVLLNTNEDYEKALDCFNTALAARPDDWLLYNRVGATMANSGQAAEALKYYHRALELNPAYIRARFNLGISCINLRQFEEAVQHISTALLLQNSDGIHDLEGLNEKRGVVSAALWDTLKTACLHMQRIDLATLCDQRNLDAFMAART